MADGALSANLQGLLGDLGLGGSGSGLPFVQQVRGSASFGFDNRSGWRLVGKRNESRNSHNSVSVPNEDVPGLPIGQPQVAHPSQVPEDTFDCFPVHGTGIQCEMGHGGDCKSDVWARCKCSPVEHANGLTVGHVPHGCKLSSAGWCLLGGELNMGVHQRGQGLKVIKVIAAQD